MTINEIKTRLEQSPSDEERRRLLGKLKDAERVTQWLPEFNPLKAFREFVRYITSRKPTK